MPASAMKACFLIAERRTIFCKDTLNICNFQIFRLFFALKIIQYYMRTVGLKEKIMNIC